jgi:voltage-gated potassium channel
MKRYLNRILHNLVYWDYTLLVVVFFLVFIVPFFPENLHGRLYHITITLIYIFAALSVGRKGVKYIVPLAIVVMALEWLSSFLGLDLINTVSKLFTIIFFVLIVIHYIIGIARAKNVNAEVILNAINGYLLISVLFSILVGLIMVFDPHAFNFPDLGDEVNTIKNQFVNYMYYSLVSITTLGYGDIVPKTPYAKSLATLVSITGQFYIAILVAMLVGKYASRQTNK